MKGIKKSLSLILALVMLLTSFAAVSFDAFADDDNEVFINGVYYDYEIKNGKAIITFAYVSGNSAPEIITVPSKIKGKKVVAFEGMGMETTNTKSKTLVIPDCVERIGGTYSGGFVSGGYVKSIAFTNLSTVKIGKGVKTIAYNPFTSSKVKSFVVNKANKYFSASDGVLFNKKKTVLVAYACGKKNKSYTVPKTVKTIGAYAFNNTERLKTINTNNVKTIKGEAFEFAEIVTFKIGASLKSATAESIGFNTSLKKITVNKKNKYFSVKDNVLFNKKKTKLVYYPGTKTNKSYSVPKTVKTIGKQAFYFTLLQKITLSGSVTKVEKRAFEGTMAQINIPSKLKSIGAYAYSGTLIKKANLPSTLTTLGKGAFEGCSSLVSVDMSKTKLKAIPQSTFASTDSLETVKFPSTLTKLADEAFFFSGIKELTIPESVKSVGNMALYSEALRTLTVNGADTAFDSGALMVVLYPGEGDESVTNTIVIKGKEGSKAQAYAAEYGLTFVKI